MDQTQRNLAIRILREQVVARTNKNNVIRKSFGTRMTIALTQECDQRDREIEAINGTIAMLETAED